MKHVGKMKNNSAKIVVVYRTLPGDANSALVVGTNGLADSYHDTLMSLVESDAGQGANELADVLATRRFPDGTVMLSYLHSNGHLKKVPTVGVLMTPNSQTMLPLNELNKMIAEQKGVTVDQLAVTDGTEEAPKAKTKAKKSEEVVVDEPETPAPASNGFKLSPAEMRSRADALFKEAQRLRKEADAQDPPAKKTTKAKAEA